MLYEFAITPEVFDKPTLSVDPSLAVVLVELLIGLRLNGMVANLHKDKWIRHVKDERIALLSPSLKDKLLTCLDILQNRHRLVKHPRSAIGDPGTDDEWLDLALESHTRIPFHGIVLSQGLLTSCGHNCDAFVELNEVLDSSMWENRPHTRTLRKVRSDYRNALMPVLRHARALTLVDPYMSCQESRYFNTVKLCADLLGQRGHDVLRGRIHIHAGNPERDSNNPEMVEDRLSAWERKLRPLIDAWHPHRFRVFLWDQRAGGERLHERYILTDQVGIAVTAGLDYRDHSAPKSTTWALLDEKDRARRLEDYDRATSPFISGRCWDRTSDLCRVKAALSR